MEIISIQYGVLRITTIVVLAIVSIVHFWTVFRFIANPLPFLSRTLPCILSQILMGAVFVLILFQSTLPIR